MLCSLTPEASSPMSRAYISDTVLDATGKPIVGASVTLLRASDYSSPPVADPGPGSANYIAQTPSGPGGAFSFDHIPYDDYHLMVKYGALTSFRYNVAAIPAELADTKETQGRVLVPRTLSRILAGESVVIHFVGDSITVGYNSTGTVGGGFVQRMGVLIAQQLAPTAAVQRYDPNAYGALSDGPINGWNGPTVIQSPSGGSSQVIQIVNNGVSGDTVQRVLRRYGNLTGWSPRIDMHVIYLGVNDSLTNDSTKFVTPPDFHAGMRSLVDIVRHYYPQSEIVLCTPHANDQPDAGNGGSIPQGTYTLDQYAMATRRVALELGVALVDLRQLWADAKDTSNAAWAGSDFYPPTWLSNGGGNHTHPLDQGHQAIAEEMIKIFGSAGLAAGRSQRIQTLGPQKHFKELEVVRLPISNPAVSLSGIIPPGGWVTYNPAALGALYYSTSLKRSHAFGDTMVFTDRMQDFAILTRRGRDCGQITVQVDAGTPQTIDLYRGFPSNISDTSEDGAVYPMDKIWVARGLLDGEHTITLTVLGSHNLSSSDSWCYLDGVEYTRWGYTSQKLECPVELSKVQFGSFTAALAAAYFGTVALSFPKPFRDGNVPTVVASANQLDHYCTVDAINNLGCNIRVVHRDGTNETTNVTGQWLAIG